MAAIAAWPRAQCRRAGRSASPRRKGRLAQVVPEAGGQTPARVTVAHRGLAHPRRRKGVRGGASLADGAGCYGAYAMAIRPTASFGRRELQQHAVRPSELRQRVGERHARERLRADGAEIAANGEPGTCPSATALNTSAIGTCDRSAVILFTLDLNFETGDCPRGERARQQQAAGRAAASGRPPGWRRA